MSSRKGLGGFRTSRAAGTIAVASGLLLAASCTDSPPTPGGAEPPPPVEPTPPPPPPPPAASVVSPPPISGGTLLVLRDGGTAVASDPDRDRIYIVDLIRQRVRATVMLPGRAEPGRAVEDGEGRVHVALRGAGAVATIDARDGRLLPPARSARRRAGWPTTAPSKLLHVACAGGELVSIAPMAEAPVRTLKLDRDLRDVVVRGDRLLVTTFRSAELLAVGPAGVEQRLRPPRTRAAFSSG